MTVAATPYDVLPNVVFLERVDYSLPRPLPSPEQVYLTLRVEFYAPNHNYTYSYTDEELPDVGERWSKDFRTSDDYLNFEPNDNPALLRPPYGAYGEFARVGDGRRRSYETVVLVGLNCGRVNQGSAAQ